MAADAADARREQQQPGDPPPPPSPPPHGRRVVFVSGCYDLLHAGHLRFFESARALGDRLVVSFAGDAVLAAHKAGRRPSLPSDHKLRLLRALRCVDEVVVGDSLKTRGLDFEEHFLRIRPALLVATEDDRYVQVKRELCAKVGAEYVVLPKDLDIDKTSTTEILRNIRAPDNAPLRVDFGGGWLDVPRFARAGAFVVNCAISPCVSLGSWPFHIGGGLGGSAAHALLCGRDAVASELDLGVGWQDPAVIREGGLCVWRSGPAPVLDLKAGGGWLRGRMAVWWTGAPHVTPDLAERPRDFGLIERAGARAREAVLLAAAAGAGGEDDGNDRGNDDALALLADAVQLSYEAQLGEGMAPLPASGFGELATKYLGGGHGGYALLLFAGAKGRDAFVAARAPGAVAVEPFVR